MLRCPGRWAGLGFALVFLLLPGCQSIIRPVEGNLSFAPSAAEQMAKYATVGDTTLLHDPSIIREGSTYYVFGSDWIGQPPDSSLRIRCSQDEVNWTACGSVFLQIPAWIGRKVPGAVSLWAPDVSYFSGLYHVYYAGSTAGSQRSVIGLATNVTLDPSDPNYKWVDGGEVLESAPGDNFNAIDPNILIDAAGSVWLTYGSYWSGIQQTEVDPRTGMLLEGSARYALATRPGVPSNPIEGASIVRHGNFYYLFVSVDYCCDADVSDDNYKEAVGRSSTPQGPFVDMNGTAMMNGGGTVILEAQGSWTAPGGAAAYVDGTSGESAIVFHALKMTENGAPYLWVKHISWQNDWPVLM
jgi:arabinan endo-1,5-alpha-L-arabinosidase